MPYWIELEVLVLIVNITMLLITLIRSRFSNYNLIQPSFVPTYPNINDIFHEICKEIIREKKGSSQSLQTFDFNDFDFDKTGEAIILYPNTDLKIEIMVKKCYNIQTGKLEMIGFNDQMTTE